MRESTPEETVGNNESNEQEKSTTPVIPPSPDRKTRFLKRRTQRNVLNGYHSSHNPKSVATIPDTVDKEADEEDREDPLIFSMKKEVSDEDMKYLKQELAHLPFDTILRILSMNSFDVNLAISIGKQMDVPDLVPQYIKDFFVANIAVERTANTTRGTTFKHFYLAKDLRKVVDTRNLVNFYYGEKNKIGGNWRLEKPDLQLSPEEKTELDERMKRNNISILTRDPSVPYKQTRGQKAAATRRANQLKREAREANGDGSQEKDTDSDTISVNSLEGPSTSEQTTSNTSFPAPPHSRLSDASNGVNGVAPKRKYTRRSTEERQIGPRRSLPGRQRKPPTFFE